MSAQDPRPAPRRRKLVLRKIADGAARAPAEAAPSSGSISAVRSPPQASHSLAQASEPSLPKPRPSLLLPLESDPALTEPHSEAVVAARQEPEQEPEEVEPEEAIALEEDPAPQAPSPQAWFSPADDDDWRASDVGDIAAMTPAVPREAAEAAVPAWAPLPAQPAAQPSLSLPRMNTPGVTPGPSREWTPRASVAPVVNTLPPPARGGLHPFRARGRLSADSKLLAGGGALAAAMLLVALGVLLGQRSSAPGAPSAAASGPYPLVVETKAAPVALPVAPSALPSPIEARLAPTPAGVPAAKLGGPATIDVRELPFVSQLPQLSRLPQPVRAQGWSVAPAAPKSGSPASGWTVAGSPVGHSSAGTPPVAPGAGDTAEAPAPVASAAAVAPEASSTAATAPAPVDPLVQAVRDDIREDEARTK
jgi:hypothetical protein